ncbi:MFS general substrate transporter [Lichtheimia hyalospora FSU 10163]|nr:MFS general substrate transporter [Lichtheimia hyalospora FSU 10163]
MSSSTEKESRHNSFDDIEAKAKLSTDDVSYSEHDGEKIMINKPPDGGWKAWLVVLGSFCGFFATQGYGYSWGVFYSEYQSIYPGDMTALSWIGSLWYCLCNITGPIYLWMGSKFDDRYVLGIACITSSLAMMLASITNAVWQLYITQGIMSGISSSLVWFACLRGPQEWFSKRRGLAVGITMAASGVGGIVFSNLASACFDTLDYRWALRILGFMQLVLIAVAACTSWRLNPPTKNVPFIDFQDWKNKRFIFHFFVHFIGNFAFYIPSGFIPSYAKYLGYDNAMGAKMNSVMSACMIVGKIGVGFLSDYVGRFNMGVFCGLMACVAHLAVWLTATDQAGLWGFCAMYGIFGGGYIAMITALTAQIVGIERVDSGTGWAFFAWCFGGLLGQPVASAIVDRTEVPDYQGAVIFAGVLFFVGAVLVGILRVLYGGFYPFKRV